MTELEWITADEPPILVSDTRPFTHQLKLRPAKTKRAILERQADHE